MYAIFILIAAAGVGRIVYQLIQQRRCLTDEEVSDYFSGWLDKNSPAGKRLTAHLGTCEKCRNKMLNHNRNDEIINHLIEE